MVVRPLARLPRVARSAARRAGEVIRRQLITRNRRAAIALALVTIVIGVAAVRVSEWWFSPGVMLLPVLAGGLLLWPRALRILFGVVAVMLAYDTYQDRAGAGIIATVVLTGIFADANARTRKKLGMQGLRGDQMLLELKDRIRDQGTLPPLPAGWGAVSVLQAAGGASFGGDFVVSACDGKRLELAVVDVAGKGLTAGTRALMLSGAFGGLLGSVRPADFLAACNAYLQRGATAEGFVTAVHLALDLASGDYLLASAGHPPAARFDASTGTWQLTSAHGIVLGVVPELRSLPERGTLRRGDALLLYTDGLVEVPGRDIDVGTDRLLGEANRLVTAGFRAGAPALVRSLMGSGSGDDCALALIWRE